MYRTSGQLNKLTPGRSCNGFLGDHAKIESMGKWRMMGEREKRKREKRWRGVGRDRATEAERERERERDLRRGGNWWGEGALLQGAY